MNRTILTAVIAAALTIGPAAAAVADDAPVEPTPEVVEVAPEPTPEPDSIVDPSPTPSHPVLVPTEGDRGPVYPCGHPKARGICYTGTEVVPVTKPVPVPVRHPVVIPFEGTRGPVDPHGWRAPHPRPVVKLGLYVAPKLGL